MSAIPDFSNATLIGETPVVTPAVSDEQSRKVLFGQDQSVVR